MRSKLMSPKSKFFEGVSNYLEKGFLLTLYSRFPKALMMVSEETKLSWGSRKFF